MAHIALILATLASIEQVEAISESEKIVFSSIDTLQIRAFLTGGEGLVSEKQLRTKAEFVLRSAGVPVDSNDSLSPRPWLAISVMAFEVDFADGRSTGGWVYAVKADLIEHARLWRNGQLRLMTVETWGTALRLAYGPRKEARDSLIDDVKEIAEEVSNLFLATR